MQATHPCAVNSLPFEFRNQGDFVLNDRLYLDGIGAINLTVGGNLLGSAASNLQLSNSKHVVDLYGASNFVNSFTSNTQSSVNYVNGNQEVFPATYGNIGFQNGGVKTISGATTVNSLIGLGGSIVQLNAPLLLVEDAKIIGNGFGLTNYIDVQSGAYIDLTSNGTLPTIFTNQYLPIGANGAFSPITILGLTASSYNTLRIQPLVTITSLNNYANQYYQLSSFSNIGVTGFQALFSFDQVNSITGTPSRVNVSTNPSIAPLLGGFVNTVTGIFGITSPTNTVIDGAWFVGNYNIGSITGISIPGNAFCPGSSFNLTFSGNAPFNPGNAITFELSDAAGSFATPTLIASQTYSLAGGFFYVTIPNVVSQGNNYQIRGISSFSPSTYVYPITVTVTGAPSVSSITPPATFAGSQITLTGSGLLSVIQVFLTGSNAITPSIIDDSRISFTIPNGATTGPVTLLGTCAQVITSQNLGICTTPQPAFNYGNNGNLCQYAGTITPTGTFSGGSFSVPSGPGLSINNSTGIIDPSASLVGNYTLLYTIPSNANCPVLTATNNITIGGVPSLAIANFPNTICGSSNAILSVTGATNFSWLPATGLSATTGNSVVASPSSTTLYTVTGTTAGCSATLIRDVTVLPALNQGLGVSMINPFICNRAIDFALISISGAELGVNYFVTGATSSVTGDGIGAVLTVPAAIVNFSPFPFTVSAQKQACGPVSPLTITTSVIKNSLPSNTYAISLNTASVVCPNPSAISSIGVLSTDNNVIYQAFVNGSYTGTTVLGTGSNISLSFTNNVLVNGPNVISVVSGIAGCPIVTLTSTVSITQRDVPTITGVNPTSLIPGSPITINGIEMNGSTILSFAGSSFNVTPSVPSNNNIYATATLPISLPPATYSILVNNNCGFGPLFSSINVLNRTIQTSTTIGNDLCVSNPLNVSFNTIGFFNPGNQFNAIIFDANNTALGYTIGSISSTATTGTISCIIPSTLSGNNWRIRVESTQPTSLWADNGYPITVTGIPTLVPVSPQTICSGFSTNIALASNPPGANINYFVNNINPPAAIVGGSLGSGNLINQTLTGAGTLSYQVSLSLPNGCTDNNAGSVIVNVNDAPIAVAQGTSPHQVCTGDKLTINLTSQIPGTIFNYTVVSSTGITGQVGGSSTSSIINTLSGQGTVMYQVIPVGNGCTGSILNVPAVVTAQPLTTPGVSTLTPLICSGTDLVVNIDNTQNGINYSILLQGAAKASQTGNGGRIVFTIPASNFGNGNYIVSARAAAACGIVRLRDSLAIAVNSSPSQSNQVSPSSLTVCQGAPATISVLGSQMNTIYAAYIGTTQVGTSIPGTGNDISFDLQSQVFALGASTVSFKAISIGCSSGVQLNNNSQVTVVATPTVNPVFTNTLVCSDQGTNIPIQVTNNANIRWTASLTNGAVTGFATGTGLNINQILSGAGTVQYLITPSVSLCDGTTASLEVTVVGVPLSSISVKSDSVCSNTDGKITIIAPEKNVTYNLLSGNNVIDSHISTGANYTYTVASANLNPGVNTYVLQINKASCPIINANSVPSISVLAPPTKPVITSGKTQTSNCDKTFWTMTAPGPYFSYQWRFNDAKIVGANSRTFSPLANGKYSVDVFTTANCYSSSSAVDVKLGTSLTKPVIKAYGTPNDTLLESSAANGYQWYVNKKAIVGANAITYKPLYNANYQIKINPKEICFEWSDNYEVNNSTFDPLTRFEFEETDSTIDLSKPIRSIKIYPNPAKQSFNISLQSLTKNEIVLLNIYNSIGINVQTKTLSGNSSAYLIQIDRNDLPSGIYKVVLNIGKEKIIKSISFE
ncbi:MAG: T9SS type A sorting domain-containing protein [Bacteroidota bacterium]|nr:T9SS type A sorting domain-containing protein [Bacteroidota bacterium]